MSDARDIFISHVAEDSEIAVEIAQGLEQAGHTTWYYERDALPGQGHVGQERRAIEAARVIVLIISDNAISKSQRSKEVDIEVGLAHRRSLPFIPLLQGIEWPEFQERQPDWAMLLGSTVGISVPPQGVSIVLPRIVLGLEGLGIRPHTQAGLSKILNDYPLPLAATYARKMTGAVTQAQAFQVHAGLGDMAQALIKFLTLLVLAQYREDSKTLGREDQDVERELQSLEEPLLDPWVSLLHAVLSLYTGAFDPLLRDLHTFYYGKTHRSNPVADAAMRIQAWLRLPSWRRPPVIYRDFFELLLLYHNSPEGWSTQRAVLADYGQYQERMDTLRPALEQALVDLEFLAEYKLIYVQDDGAPPYRLVEATGRDLILSSQPLAPAATVRPEHLYFCRPGAAGLEPLLDLHPLLICSRCPVCQERELFFFHPGQRRQVDYVSYSSGHSLAEEHMAHVQPYLRAFLSLKEWRSFHTDKATERLREVYINALREVLEDRKIDPGERQKLDFLAKMLGLTVDQAARLEEEVRRALPPEGPEIKEEAPPPEGERFQQAVFPGVSVQKAAKPGEEEIAPAPVEGVAAAPVGGAKEPGIEAEVPGGQPAAGPAGTGDQGPAELPQKYLVCCWQRPRPAPVHQVALFGMPPAAFAADETGEVLIYSTEGRMLVRDHIEGRLYRVVALADRIVAGSWGGSLCCFDQNGLLWHKNLKSPVSALAGAGGQVVAGTWDGRLVAFEEATGHKRWQKDLADGISTVSIASGGRRVVAGTYAGHLVILDSAGDKVWLQDRQSALAAALFDREAQEVVVVTRNHICCIQVEDQAVVWEQAIGHAPIDMGMSGNNRLLAVGVKSGQIFLFNVNGAISLRNAEHRLEALVQVLIPPLAPDGPLTLVLSRRDGLFALDNRTQAMTQETEAPGNRSAVSFDGRYVLVGGDTGVALYRLAKPALRATLAPKGKLVQGRKTPLKITLQNMGERLARQIEVRLEGPVTCMPLQLPSELPAQWPSELPAGKTAESDNQLVCPEMDGTLPVTVRLRYHDDLGLQYETEQVQMLDAQAGA